MVTIHTQGKDHEKMEAAPRDVSRHQGTLASACKALEVGERLGEMLSAPSAGASLANTSTLASQPAELLDNTLLLSKQS